MGNQSKVIIASDLHIHPHKKSLGRLYNCLEVLEWIFKTAHEKEAGNIIFAGDLFHDRQKVDVLTYQHTFEIFEKYLCGSQLKAWLLLGNHDMWHKEKWDYSSVKPLGAVCGVTVIDTPCTIALDGCTPLINFLPFTTNPIDALSKLENDSEFKILFAHIAVDGALWNVRSNTFAEVFIEHDGDMVKVDAGILSKWDQVFLGHYHASQQITDKIEYVGSPLQLSYGEAFQKKHIILYDLNTHEKEYITNTFSPKHYVYDLSECSRAKFDENVDLFVKIKTDDITSPKNIEVQKKILELPNCKEAKVDPIKKHRADEKREIEDAKAILLNEDEMAKHYLDEVGTNGLDRQKLLNVFKMICNKREQNA